MSGTRELAAAPADLSLVRRLRRPVLVLAILVMGALAVLKLGDEFRRLLWETQDRGGAVDLRDRHIEVDRWFDGIALYGEKGSAVYPPASYALLWPFLGWLPVEKARWLWAATTVLVLVWLARIVARESLAEGPLEKVFLVLAVLSMNAVGVTIGVGQVSVHLLPALATACLLARRPASWATDLCVVALMTFCLVKPPNAAPFFWILVFVPRRWRPAALVVASYALLTVLASWFQDFQVSRFGERSMTAAAFGSVRGGYGNLHTWLTEYDLQRFNPHASLLLLAAAGWWVYRHRGVDVWLLLGTMAFVARIWVYHRMYDNCLFALMMVAVFREGKKSAPGEQARFVAPFLLASLVVAMLVPARVLKVWPEPWPTAMATAHTVLWFTTVAFLMVRAREERQRAGAATPRAS